MKETNRALIARLRETAHLVKFSPAALPEREDRGPRKGESEGDYVRRITELYRDSWLEPVIAEIEKRLCK